MHVHQWHWRRDTPRIRQCTSKKYRGGIVRIDWGLQCLASVEGQRTCILNCPQNTAMERSHYHIRIIQLDPLAHVTRKPKCIDVHGAMYILGKADRLMHSILALKSRVNQLVLILLTVPMGIPEVLRTNDSSRLTKQLILQQQLKSDDREALQ